jgi:hypothetical protein
MPTFVCLCDTAISLSVIPSTQGFRILSEEILDALIENLVTSYANSDSREDFERKAFNNFFIDTPGIAQIIECPNCGRLAVFSRASDSVPKLWYKIELATVEGVESLRSVVDKVTRKE